MTTPTPIATFEDILTALENNPALRAALRQHVLDQEFLQLPAIVSELQKAVSELQQTVAELAQLIYEYIAATNERLDRLENDVREVKAGQARLEGNMNRLEGNMNRLEGNMNRLIGSDYERKAARRASRLIRRQLDITDLQVIYAVTAPDNNHLPNLLDQAVSAGKISLENADELENADIVLVGENRYAIVEVSLVMDENDVLRARGRADLLAQAAGLPVTAATIGTYALDSAAQQASENDVEVLILPE